MSHDLADYQNLPDFLPNPCGQARVAGDVGPSDHDSISTNHPGMGFELSGILCDTDLDMSITPRLSQQGLDGQRLNQAGRARHIAAGNFHGPNTSRRAT